MTYSERNGWILYLNDQWHEHEKQDHYLAQIAYITALVNAGKGRKPKLKDFLLEFKTGDEAAKPDWRKNKRLWFNQIAAWKAAAKPGVIKSKSKASPKPASVKPNPKRKSKPLKARRK